ncbi:MAG: penicillin-binding protein 2 [Patescibacteria group bacterium]
MVSKKQKKKIGPDRVYLLAIAIFIFAGFAIFRLFDLQILRNHYYEALASGQHEISEKLMAERGEIYVRERNSDELFPIAQNQELNLVFSIPRKIKNPKEVLDKITPVLEITEEEVPTMMERLSKEGDLYEPLRHLVSDQKVAELEKLEIEGIDWMPETNRYYPEKNIYSHITGFWGYLNDQRVGQYGLEGYLDEQLCGKTGSIIAEKDAGGRFITIGQKFLEEAQDGDDFVLTIDRTIQYNTCSKLKEATMKHGADKGSVIVLDPKTGAILAMCNYPDYDPNDYSATEDIEAFKNTALYDMWEPGSVFKSITMAAGLDLGLVSPGTTYVDTGELKYGKYTIKNSDGKAYGTQTMTNVLEESLNTGAVFVAEHVGNERFYNYVRDFGFGERIGLPLESESVGDLSTIAKLRDIYTATASYGQGITVTPIQLIMAYSAIANDGLMMRPFIIDEIVKNNGTTVKSTPEEMRQVISAEAANTLSAMLVSVLENGHAQRALVPGYFMAGKTGTAQVARSSGAGYESGLHKDTFVGFGPISDPQFVVLTKLDNPKDVPWAASSAAPLFGEIAQFLVNYYQIPPERTIDR